MQEDKHVNKLSEWGKTITGYSPVEAFLDLKTLRQRTNDDITAFVHLYILDGIPYIFINKPFVYWIVRSTFANKLNILATNIGVTGSAKLGFSLVPQKWCNDFSLAYSDIDFFVISSNLFELLIADFRMFESDVHEGRLKNNWCSTFFDGINKRIDKGFIDSNQIHPCNRYKNVIKCNEAIWFVAEKIKGFFIEYANVKVKSIRCYKDRATALRQMTLNLSYAIDNACQREDDIVVCHE